MMGLGPFQLSSGRLESGPGGYMTESHDVRELVVRAGFAEIRYTEELNGVSGTRDAEARSGHRWGL